jgi:large subunit ribosomal protein L25
MEAVTITATPRDVFGKGAARKTRAKGLMPAVIYRAGQPATSITLDAHDLENAFRKTGNRNTLVDLGVGDAHYICLVKATQRDPLTTNLLHVDFFQVVESEAVNVVVPIEPVGKSLGETAGGSLRVIRRELNVTCKPGDIPQSVKIDVSHMNVGDFIRVSDLVTENGVAVEAASDFNIVTVLGKREILEEEVAVEADAEGAEGAEGSDGSEAAE